MLIMGQGTDDYGDVIADTDEMLGWTRGYTSVPLLSCGASAVSRTPNPHTIAACALTHARMDPQPHHGVSYLAEVCTLWVLF